MVNEVRAAIARCLEGQFEWKVMDAADVSAGRGAVRVVQRLRAERAVITFDAELRFAGGWHYSILSVAADPPSRRSWAGMPTLGATVPPDWAWVRVEIENAFRDDFVPRFLEAMDQLVPAGAA